MIVIGQLHIVNRKSRLKEKIASFAHILDGKELVVVADVDRDGSLALGASDNAGIFSGNAVGMNCYRREILGLEHGAIESKITSHGVPKQIHPLSIDADELPGVLDYTAENLRSCVFKFGVAR